MRKLYFSFIIVLFCSNISIADIKNEAIIMTSKAQECFFSLPSYAQDGAIDSWIDTKKYFNDAIKEEKMGDPRNLASIFYKNAKIYAGVVIQIGSAYGSKICK